MDNMVDSAGLYAILLIADIFCILQFFIVSGNIRHIYLTHYQRNKFNQLMKVTFAMTVFDILWIIQEGFGLLSFRPLALAVNCCHLSMGVLLSYCSLCFVAARAYGTAFEKKHRLQHILFIVAALSIMVNVLSVLTGWSFTVDKNGLYQAGPYYAATQAAVIFALMLFSAAISLYRARIGVLPIVKGEFFRLAFIALIPSAYFAVKSMLSVVMPSIVMPSINVSVTIVLVWVLSEYQNTAIQLDYLTLLPNRRAMHSTFERCVEKLTGDKRIYLYMIDIDNFGNYNRTHGHPAGDEALRKFGAVLNEVCFEHIGTLASRFGGDEFMLLAVRPEGFDAQELYFDIVRKLKEKNVDFTISVGAVCNSDNTLRLLDAVYTCADAAMFMAKERGRDTFIYLTPDEIEQKLSSNTANTL